MNNDINNTSPYQVPDGCAKSTADTTLLADKLMDAFVRVQEAKPAAKRPRARAPSKLLFFADSARADTNYENVKEDKGCRGLVPIPAGGRLHKLFARKTPPSSTHSDKKRLS